MLWSLACSLFSNGKGRDLLVTSVGVFTEDALLEDSVACQRNTVAF